MRDAPKVATLPLGLTILPLLVGAASGVGVQGLIFVLYGSGLNFDFVMSLIAFSISSILAALICVYPIFMVFPRSRVPAAWAGTIDEIPPEGLDAIIDTTPVWGPDLEALKRLKPGGRLVINAIRKEESDKEILLKLDYASQLWMEKEIKSVANVTRADVREFLQVAAEANIKPEVQEYDLKDANAALMEMKQGKIRGAKVLRV